MLVERPGVFFLTFDLDGHIVESNASWQARFGVAPSEPFVDTVAAESRATVSALFERLRAGITIPSVELRLVPEDGDPFVVTGMISPMLDDDQVVAAFGVLKEQRPAVDADPSQPSTPADPHQLAALLEFAPAGMLLVDASESIVAYNRQFLEIWGLDENVVRAGQAREAATRIVENPDAFLATLEGVYEDRDKTLTGTVRLRDGRGLDWYTTATWDLDGNYLGRAWYYTDATARYIAEQDLRRSEELYRQLVASFPDGGVFIYDDEFTFVLANGEDLRRYGLSPETIEGRRIAEVLPRRTFLQMEPLLRAALDGERRQQDISFVNSIFAVTTVPLDFGRALDGRHGMIVALDVSAERELEKRLRGMEVRLRTLIEQIPAITYVQQVRDQTNSTIYISPQVQRIFGYAPDELVDGTIPWVDTLHPEDRDAVIAGTEAANTSSQGFVMEYRILTRDGDVRWVRDEASVIADERGTARFWQGILTDITEERRLEEALRESESLFRSAFDDAPNGVALISLDGGAKRLNKAFCDLVGYAAEDVPSPQTISALTHPDDRDHDRAQFRRLIDREVDGYQAVKRFIRADGQTIWARMDVSFVFDEQGEPDYIVAHFQDVTEQFRLEEELRRSEEIFRSAFDHAAVGMARVAPDGRWLDANASVCRMFGYSRDELLALDFQALTHPDDLQEDLGLVRQVLEGTLASYTIEKRYFHKDGNIVWGQLSVSLVRADDGKPLFFISQIQDVTEKKGLEARLERLALHDSLTGILNRHGLSQALAESDAAGGDQVAILMLDMDDFKSINDTHGHAAGDAVLCEIARRIQVCLRSVDIVARLGGDEFAIVLRGPVDRESAEAIAGRIQAAVAAPLRLGSEGLAVECGISIGLKLGERSTIETQLLRAADNAMYEDKRRRKAA